MFHIQSHEAVHSLGPDSVKVYTWLPTSTLAVVRMFRKDLQPLIRAEAERRGLPFDIVAHEVCFVEVFDCPCVA